jgi:broad specificity phosphatase PhoE
VAQALATAAVTAVWGSPLERARLSAEIVAKPHHLAVTAEPDFREMSFGQWEGLTREEVAARFPREWEVWRQAPARFAAPGGEALPAVAERVSRGLAALKAASQGGTVVLVSHAIVVRLIVLAALGLGPDRLWTVDAAPAGISELEYGEDWVTVHRLNTVGHLDGDRGMA